MSDECADNQQATPLPVASSASVGFSPECLDCVDGAMQAEIDAAHYAAISLMIAREAKALMNQIEKAAVKS